MPFCFVDKDHEADCMGQNFLWLKGRDEGRHWVASAL